VKRGGDLDVYVTDARGTVIFLRHRAEVGRDFSLWRDVKLTLEGRYGKPRV
jgi:two-component system sensor histidine kinase CreC